MPTYEYLCAKCGEQFQVQQSFADPALKKHKGCGGTLSKVFGVPAISLKGSGFYKTDNPSSSRASSAKSEAGDAKSESTTSSAPAEKKSEKKAEKKSATSSTKAAKPSSGTT
jgi:putative FmdB family regulatory protein